ncbi:hypothetical protein AWC16_17540 [Mycolicibacter longobardus]|uniref:DUF3298 domain-containing protein n=1 Tax=Mycolicibacter longobardus TaxID=1108812 RepID=A0A1X1YDM5_9MYCO|nr:hypothetical protein AWC16_17540 [Mycolicibacter longobardus]
MFSPRRTATVLVLLLLSSTVVTGVARAEPAPAAISGTSPDGLGTWSVQYQRLHPGQAQAAEVINDQIDAAAMREVTQATWDGSTRRPWTFDATGTINVRAATVSEVFRGTYNTAEPHMPMHTVGSIVCDAASGVIITWDNLFHDKTAGLQRLGDQLEATLAAQASPTQVRDWKRAGKFAPVDINFKSWIPTREGVQLHFPELQFGPGHTVVAVPWAAVREQIVPEFLSITE